MNPKPSELTQIFLIEFAEKLLEITSLDDKISNIEHTVTYELKEPIPDELDLSRCGYIDTWYRSNHLHPFYADNSDPPFFDEPKTYVLTPDFYPKITIESCMHENCEYFRGDNIFCSQHSIKSIDNIIEKINVRIQEIIKERKLFLESLVIPKCIKISYRTLSDEDYTATLNLVE
jgi:hypothetical protein